MKIKLDIDNRVVECEREPMPPERFDTVCKLVKAGGGAVGLLVAIHMVGVRAIVGALVALLFYGFYQLMKF